MGFRITNVIRTLDSGSAVVHSETHPGTKYRPGRVKSTVTVRSETELTAAPLPISGGFPVFVPAHLVQLVEDDVAAQFALFTAGTHETALQYDAITWAELVEVFGGLTVAAY